MTDSQYILAAAGRADAESARLAKLEEFYDPGTTRRLDDLGIPRGARCLEVGAGRGSIARWLAGQVGPSGQVVAADIDCRFLHALPANVEVRRLDITTDELEPDSYDLAHCRAVLFHLKDPVLALNRMVSALRPDGVLLAEEGDYGLWGYGGHPDATWCTEVFHRCLNTLATSGTMHNCLGRKLPGMLVDAGMELGGGEIDTAVARSGEPLFELMQDTWAAIAAPLVAGGQLTEEDRARFDEAMRSPSTAMTGVSVVSAWARRVT